MSTSEVFRPTDGDLVIRDNIAQGTGMGGDMFQPGSRPATQGGYRFGQLSHNSFFTRHNPHPHRVRHIKGLLDVPICSVNDDGYFASPRYSLAFPPNNFNHTKLNNWKGRIPVNAINVNSQLHPINTVTGLQYFMGLNSYPYREKAIPKVGLVPVTEAWRDELKRFADGLGDVPLTKDPARDCLPKAEEERPKTTMYSQETGRLIPPPSRAMSRGNSRRGQRTPYYGLGGNLQHIAPAPDMENVVLTMLCQILQTEDVNAVQAWLCSSGEKEKVMVMEMIKAAMVGREEYWKQYPPMVMDNKPTEQKTILPPINGAPRPPTGEMNRLVLEEQPQAMMLEPPNAALRTVVEDKDFTIDPPTNDVFRPSSQLKRPSTQQAPRPPTGPPPALTKTEETLTEEPQLKYTKTPLKESVPQVDATWNQHESVNTF
ncbi:protein TBATA-like isoform X2 [Littorina saxatilis]